MKTASSFSIVFYYSLFFFFFASSAAFGQYTRDLSQVDFQGKEVTFPNPNLMNNYNRQTSFVIYPDYHLTPEWVKAGAYFRYNGYDVRAENVVISVYLPKSGNVWGYREHIEYNVNAPDWSGWWDEPWRNGFFCYTVKAQYNGVWYETAFEVRPNTIFRIFEVAKYGAELYINSQGRN